MIGETVGHYRVQTELGRGGMGVVFRAEDLKLGREVALKFLADSFSGDLTVHDRFLREARAAAALSHPNICTIYEINDSGGRPFIAMELLEGQTLQARLASGPLPQGELLDLAIQITDALAAAHAKGLIHRDIKPGNIFVTADGRAKVVDFGLAKAFERSTAATDQSAVETILDDEATVTRSGTTVGTVAYMSPEQARGERVDARSDIFSLGLVLYEMATGRRAFDGATTAVVFDGILNRTPPAPSSVNPGVPPELEQVISCAIEKDRGNRYQSAADLAGDLRRLRRVSDPAVAAVSSQFVPKATGPVSPGWGVTPAAGVAAAPHASSVRVVPARSARLWRSRTIALAALLVVLTAAAAGTAWWLRRGRPVAEGAPVLVTDFVNRTGDADFDGTLKQALTIKLEESPYVRVMSSQKVQQLLALMARRPDEPVTASVGRDMCQRMGAGALMTGEISRLGSTYVLTLAAESCATGEEIWREQAQAARKEEVLQALGAQVSSVRQRLGESLTSVRSHDKPLADATTSSLAALRSFSQGDQKRAMGVDLEAVPFYQRAIELDPQFALAYARLGTVYSNIGEMEQAKRSYAKAYDLRDRAGDHERLYITSHYFRVNGDLAKTREIYELWRQTYPHDFVPVHNIGIYYEEMGDLERALQAFRDASAMDPRSPLARESVAGTLFALGRFEEGRRVAEQEVKDLGDSPAPHLMLYQLDYLVGDRAGMAEHARKLEGKPAELDREAVDYQIAMYEGRVAAAGSLLQEAAVRAEGQGRVELARGGRTGHVLNRALVGFTRETGAAVTRLLSADRSDPKELSLAFALAIAGDTARAHAVAAPLWQGLRSDPATDRIVKPAFDALLEVRQRRPARALDLLKAAEPWEERMHNASFLSADVRGLAYLALDDGRAAEAQFGKRLRHPGIDPFSVSSVLAHVYIGRARTMAGDKAGARQAYEEFFKLWKDADPDIPLLQQAKAEYAKLAR
jgi:eukaryotic-like serine/threonine-protein kinase